MFSSAPVARLRIAMLFAATFVLLALLPGTATAQNGQVIDDDGWCDERGWNRRGGNYCEVREFMLGAGALSVDGGANGGISVEAWDRNEIRVLAKVVAHADSDDDARRVADDVVVETAGLNISADGRSRGHDESWWVSYRVFVPRSSDLSLAAHNGGISIKGVRGEVRFETSNGGLHLEDLAGDVRGSTSNGGISVRLTGDRWDGTGLDVVTRNGGVKVAVPDGYSAEFESGTRNGGLRIDFPVRVQGDIGRRLHTTLGSGGAPVRVMTTNGGVRIGRN